MARGGGEWASLINKNTHKEGTCIQRPAGLALFSFCTWSISNTCATYRNCLVTLPTDKGEQCKHWWYLSLESIKDFFFLREFFFLVMFCLLEYWNLFSFLQCGTPRNKEVVRLRSRALPQRTHYSALWTPKKSKNYLYLWMLPTITILVRPPFSSRCVEFRCSSLLSLLAKVLEAGEEVVVCQDVSVQQ